MAKYSNLNTRIWLDEFDLSGFLNSAAQDVKQETIPVTCFSDAGPRRLVGNYDHSHQHGGFFDGADDSFDEQIFAMLNDTDDHYLGHCFGANIESSIVYESVIRLDGQPRTAQIGQAVLLNLSGQGANGMSRGQVIRNATISANGNGTGRNIGASTLGQTFQVVIRVFSGTFTSFDVNIQESSDDAAGDPYATIAALSQTGIAAAGVWRKTIAVASEAWKRVNIANWNGTSALVAVTAGIVQGT